MASGENEVEQRATSAVLVNCPALPITMSQWYRRVFSQTEFGCVVRLLADLAPIFSTI